jgi:Zn-dependent protease
VSTAPRRVRHRKALQAILLVSLVVSAAVFHRIYEAGLGDITVLLLLAPLVLMTVIVHEVSHGWVALQLGDPTAKERGRLTFNPLKHISFKWTVLFPITTLYLFGVGLIMPKPVPVNARNFENPKTDIIWVGLAGPAVNIALMLFFAVILGSGIVPNGGAGFFVRQLLTVLIIVNMVLAMFNLIPIPPLDGSRLLTGLLPARHRHFLMRVEILGLLFIFAMVIGTKLSVGIEEVLRPPIKFVWEMLGLDRNELHRLLDGPHP